MFEKSTTSDEMLWSFVWWAIALAAAIVVYFGVSAIIADDPAAGLIFAGVAFVLVGGLMVRFGPGPGPSQQVWHDDTNDFHPLPAVNPSVETTPEPAARVSEPMPVAEPVAPVGEPIPPTAEPATTAVEPVAEPEASADTPPPGTGVSERVREAARAAREAAADLAGPAPEATRPAALEAPRDGKADDLKKIKGVGPKLEELLHSLGIYHFGQIAAWGPSEVAWMDSNLEGFFGRVTRDDWVGQAKVLAAGDETEFSKRVDEGDVY